MNYDYKSPTHGVRRSKYVSSTSIAITENSNTYDCIYYNRCTKSTARCNKKDCEKYTGKRND